MPGYNLAQKMAFLPELQEFLKAKGKIYTVRKYFMLDAVVKVSNVGPCYRKRVAKIGSVEDMQPYVELSGFSSKEDWWRVLQTFLPDKEPSNLYLYLITKIPEESLE
jgi:hypothetical protein